MTATSSASPAEELVNSIEDGTAGHCSAETSWGSSRRSFAASRREGRHPQMSLPLPRAARAAAPT